MVKTNRRKKKSKKNYKQTRRKTYRRKTYRRKTYRRKTYRRKTYEKKEKKGGSFIIDQLPLLILGIIGTGFIGYLFSSTDSKKTSSLPPLERSTPSYRPEPPQQSFQPRDTGIREREIETPVFKELTIDEKIEGKEKEIQEIVQKIVKLYYKFTSPPVGQYPLAQANPIHVAGATSKRQSSHIYSPLLELVKEVINQYSDHMELKKLSSSQMNLVIRLNRKMDQLDILEKELEGLKKQKQDSEDPEDKRNDDEYFRKVVQDITETCANFTPRDIQGNIKENLIDFIEKCKQQFTLEEEITLLKSKIEKQKLKTGDVEEIQSELDIKTKEFVALLEEIKEISEMLMNIDENNQFITISLDILWGFDISELSKYLKNKYSFILEKNREPEGYIIFRIKGAVKLVVDVDVDQDLSSLKVVDGKIKWDPGKFEKFKSASKKSLSALGYAATFTKTQTGKLLKEIKEVTSVQLGNTLKIVGRISLISIKVILKIICQSLKISASLSSIIIKQLILLFKCFIINCQLDQGGGSFLTKKMEGIDFQKFTAEISEESESFSEYMVEKKEDILAITRQDKIERYKDEICSGKEGKVLTIAILLPNNPFFISFELKNLVDMFKMIIKFFTKLIIYILTKGGEITLESITILLSSIMYGIEREQPGLPSTTGSLMGNISTQEMPSMCSEYKCPDGEKHIDNAGEIEQGEDPLGTCCEAPSPAPAPLFSTEIPPPKLLPQRKSAPARIIVNAEELNAGDLKGDPPGSGLNRDLSHSAPLMATLVTD